MASLYALFILFLVFPAVLLIVVDSFFLVNVRDERARQAIQNGLGNDVVEQLSKRPEIIELARSMAPWLLLIFAVRAFVVEPFNIPSTSMLPQLAIGDEIAVTKYDYGIRDPIFHRLLVSTYSPERADLVIFKNPEAPSLDYIKRVIGVPGDRIVYKNKQIWIGHACLVDQDNCPPLQPLTRTKTDLTLTDSDGTKLTVYNETLGDVTYQIALSDSKSDDTTDYYSQRATIEGEFIVPAKHVFVMGDNRDNSRDSRFFGFVSEDALMGRPALIMANLVPRNEDDWIPSWIPAGISLNKAGAIH